MRLRLEGKLLAIGQAMARRELTVGLIWSLVGLFFATPATDSRGQGWGIGGVGPSAGIPVNGCGGIAGPGPSAGVPTSFAGGRVFTGSNLYAANAPYQAGCGTNSWNNGSYCGGFPGRGCFPWNRSYCYSSATVVGVPFFGFGYSPYLYAAGGGYYGSPSFDPAMAEQNYLLREQLRELREQNDELRRDGAGQAAGGGPPAPGAAPRAGGRINVPIRGRKTPDQIARDRQVQAELKAKRYTTTGARLFTQGLYHRAAEQFRQATRQVADDATPHFYLAQSLFAAGKFSEAARAVKDGLKINPDWVEADFDMRDLYGNPGDLVPQINTLARDLKANPLDKNALFLLGFELFMTGEKARAQTVFEQVARLEADDRHLVPFFDFYQKEDAAADTPLMNAAASVPAAPAVAQDGAKVN